MKVKTVVGFSLLAILFVFTNFFSHFNPKVADSQIKATLPPVVSINSQQSNKLNIQETKQPTISSSIKNELSSDNTYVNAAGNTIHSPAYSDTAPSSATAICKDGTYSFSQNRRGTCSHHGGVAQWL